MKSRRWMKWIYCLVFSYALTLSAEARREELTLLLVPRDNIPRQIGLDVAGRYPTLLITYRLVPGGGVSLHGWTGTKWVNITPADYVSGAFFKKGPSSALIVEKKGMTIPSMLVPSEAWCGDVFKITTSETRPLLHLTGQYFDFPYQDWRWFAQRYRQEVSAINPDGINMSWYHKRLGDHLKGGTPQDSGDLQYWVALRHQAEQEAAEGVASGKPAEVDGDPFTNAVPPAVVMGAGDVPEEEGNGSPDTDAEEVSEAGDSKE